MPARQLAGGGSGRGDGGKRRHGRGAEGAGDADHGRAGAEGRSGSQPPKRRQAQLEVTDTSAVGEGSRGSGGDGDGSDSRGSGDTQRDETVSGSGSQEGNKGEPPAKISKHDGNGGEVFAKSPNPANDAGDGNTSNVRAVDCDGWVEGESEESERNRAEQQRRWDALKLEWLGGNALPELEASDPSHSADEEGEGWSIQLEKSVVLANLMAVTRRGEGYADHSVISVKSDGNCLYRALAIALGITTHAWMFVDTD